MKKPIKRLPPRPTNTWVARLAWKVARRLPLVTVGANHDQRIAHAAEISIFDERIRWMREDLHRMVNTLAEVPPLFPHIYGRDVNMDIDPAIRLELSFDPTFYQFPHRPRRRGGSQELRHMIRSISRDMAHFFADDQLSKAIEKVALAKLGLDEIR